jgi:hypothetical protein
VLCSCTSASAIEQEEWEAFAAHFRTFWTGLLTNEVTPSNSGAIDTTGAPAQGSEAKAYAWDALVKRPCGRSLLSSRAYPALAGLLDASALPAAPEHGTAVRGGAMTLSGTARSTVADVLGALHSVFEDLLLSQLLWRHVPRLAALLAGAAQLAGASEWEVWPASVTVLVAPAFVDLKTVSLPVAPNSKHMRRTDI